MERAKKAAAPLGSPKEAREELGMVMGAPVSQEPAEEAASGRVIGPAEGSDLAGREGEAELFEGGLTEYSVTAEGGLRLREQPSLEAPVLAELPWGVGVFADEPPAGEWVRVTTGLLSGYMLAEHLAPLTDALKAAIVHE